jgi:hypothetical protein
MRWDTVHFSGRYQGFGGTCNLNLRGSRQSLHVTTEAAAHLPNYTVSYSRNRELGAHRRYNPKCHVGMMLPEIHLPACNIERRLRYNTVTAHTFESILTLI